MPWLKISTTVVGMAGCVLIAFGGPHELEAQGDEPRISVTWRGTPLHDVLLTLAGVSGRSIVVGAGVAGFVTATIEDQPWDATLEAIVESHGLAIAHGESGIIRVHPLEPPGARDATDRLLTKTYRIRYTPAAEMLATLAPLLSERGSIGLAASTNTLVVSDIPRVQNAIANLLGRPGVGSPTRPRGGGRS